LYNNSGRDWEEIMPTYRITIYLKYGLYNRMEGEKWHPSHDLEYVTGYYKKLALEKVGKIKFDSIKVVMIDDDHGQKKGP
jgi:hypothetical protein